MVSAPRPFDPATAAVTAVRGGTDSTGLKFSSRRVALSGTASARLPPSRYTVTKLLPTWRLNTSVNNVHITTSPPSSGVPTNIHVPQYLERGNYGQGNREVLCPQCSQWINHGFVRGYGPLENHLGGPRCKPSVPVVSAYPSGSVHTVFIALRLE
jgi:hypothetical protein